MISASNTFVNNEILTKSGFSIEIFANNIVFIKNVKPYFTLHLNGFMLRKCNGVSIVENFNGITISVQFDTNNVIYLYRDKNNPIYVTANVGKSKAPHLLFT